MALCSRDTCRRWRPDAVVRCLRLGRHVDGDWFCSDACVEAEAARRLRSVRPQETTPPRAPALRLGAILLHQGLVTPRQLGEALEAQRGSGLRLGAQLQRLGHASRTVVLRALATQHGVSYLATIDPAAVRTAPGGLSADEVRALGLVPLKETPDSLLVACQAPLPHSAIGALQVLSGRAVEPYLVADDDFDRLAAGYGRAAEAKPRTLPARDILEGASQIAAVVAEAGDAVVKEAHVDLFTWVRIAANGRISTLLVPPYPQQLKENAEWLAATTRH